MSKNIDQIFIANPITSNASTDLMYFGQSPYGAGNDAAMTFANFSAQFGAPFTPAALTRTNDTNVTLTLGGTPATALLQATSITAGWAGQLAVGRGGTGNSTFTAYSVICAGTTATGAFQNVSGVGSLNQVLISQGAGALPQWGSVPGLTPAALTKVDDTNVTLTLGGTPATALLQATSITAGWSGQLSLARGGTNANLTAANGAIPYSTASAFALLAAGTSGQLFQSGGAGAPSWTTATFPATAGLAGTILRSNGTNWVNSTSTFADTYSVSTILYASSANAVSGLATANSAALVTNSTGVPAWSSTMTNGQVIIGSTSATPTAATLTAGTGISITNGAGSITVASTGVGSLVYNDVSGTSQDAAVNNGYIISNAGQTTVTLPATAAEGSVIAVQGKGVAGWIMAANTDQVIHLGSSASSSAGSLTSTNQWDAVTVVCVTANTTWAVSSVIGNLTVA